MADNNARKYNCLYVYSKGCGYCMRFEHNLKKLIKDYDFKCKFEKYDINNVDGMLLAMKYGISYVPYVIIVNNDTKDAWQIGPNCLINYQCVNNIFQNVTK